MQTILGLVPVYHVSLYMYVIATPGLSCGEPESPGSADDREISSPPPGGGSGELQVPVAANETVGTSGDGQTIMIIQETGSGPELASWLAGPVSAGTAGSGTTTLSTAATSTAGLGVSL